MGLILSAQNEVDQALEYYEKALEITKKIYSDDHQDVASSLNNIGVI